MNSSKWVREYPPDYKHLYEEDEEEKKVNRRDGDIPTCLILNFL
jgi:hypothetical protein